MEAIPRILSKLEQVRDLGLPRFILDRHRCLLNPTLDESASQDFEANHHIRLPEDYRTFLREAGNGGAGPYYGLDRLSLEVPTCDALARPCMVRPEMSSRERNRWIAISNTPGLPLMTMVPMMTPVTMFQDRWLQGCLMITHLGCSCFAMLVVTGEHRGRVFYIGSSSPYFVHHPDFLSWYERWLDELLWGFDDTWFGIGLPGREGDMVVVLRSDEPAETKGEAIRTLWRIPNLNRESLAALRLTLGHASRNVRIQAAHLLGKHHDAEAIPEIKGLLRDADPLVREVAVKVLATLLPEDSWVSAVREALNDDKWDVVAAALLCLKHKGFLRVADVEPCFRHRKPAARIMALQLTHVFKGELATIRTPVDLLRDPDRDVRYCAIGRCRGQRDRLNVPTLIEMLRQESDVELAEQIVFALADIRDPEALPVLLKMTEHRDSIVRYHAITALGTLRDPRAIPTLTALLEDQTKPERANEDGSVARFQRTIGQEARAALAQIRA